MRPFLWESNIIQVICTHEYNLLCKAFGPRQGEIALYDIHCCDKINPLEPELFFLILAHPVYKMWIIQEPNKLALWNKLHFEEKKWRV